METETYRNHSIPTKHNEAIFINDEEKFKPIQTVEAVDEFCP